jgi:putative flippase GtrA
MANFYNLCHVPQKHILFQILYICYKRWQKKALLSEFQSATISITSQNYIKMDTWSFKNDTMSTDFTQQVTGMITNKYLFTVV